MTTPPAEAKDPAGKVPDLVVIGHILEEIIESPLGQIGPTLGGPAAYASIAASKLGTRTGLVTFAEYKLPPLLIQPLVQAGVQLEGLQTCHATRRSLLSYDREGFKSIRYLAVPPDITDQDVPRSYWQAKAFLLCPIDFEVGVDVIERAKVSPALVLLDLGGYGGAVSRRHPLGDASTFTQVFQAARGVSALKASFEDCLVIFGPTATATLALHRLSTYGAHVTILTLGEAGALLLDGSDGSTRTLGPFPTHAVDVTGAGDIFCGAYAGEYLRTRDVIGAGLYACAAASLAVGRAGGCSPHRIPSDATVRASLRSVI